MDYDSFNWTSSLFFPSPQKNTPPSLISDKNEWKDDLFHLLNNEIPTFLLSFNYEMEAFFLFYKNVLTKKGEKNKEK
jgi:hypothetical protein